MKWICFTTPNPEVFRVTVQIPQPVIAHTDWKFEQWKDFFKQKSEEATDRRERESYTVCLKISLWAELCDGKLIDIKNVKDFSSNEPLVEMNFCISNIGHRKVFFQGLASKNNLFVELISN